MDNDTDAEPDAVEPEPSEPATAEELRARLIELREPVPSEAEYAEHVADEIAIFETQWPLLQAPIREGYVSHMLKESDPVAMTLRLLAVMDSEQLQQVGVAVEEQRQRLNKKRLSRKPNGGVGRVDDANQGAIADTDGGSHGQPRTVAHSAVAVAPTYPTPEDEVDDIGEIPPGLDRRRRVSDNSEEAQ